MHLGLVDGPFVPHNLISNQENPVPLLKFQMAPKLKTLTLGPRKEPRDTFPFCQKSRQMNFLQFPQKGPYGERCLFTGHFHLSRKPHKNKKAVKKKCPSMFPKSGAPTEADAHFRALLNISFRVPSEGALPLGPVCGIPRREVTRS